MLEQNLAIVDIETTGGSLAGGRVIELAVLRVERGELVEEFQTLVNPLVPIPKFIEGFTGIGDGDVADAPAFEEIAETVLPLFEDAVFVAHNSSFDYGFLKAEFVRLGYGFDLQTLCTVRLSRSLFPEHKRHSLDAIIQRFGFTCPRRHRALDDARVVYDFLRQVSLDMPKDRLGRALDKVIKKLPPRQVRKAMNDAAVDPVCEYVQEL